MFYPEECERKKNKTLIFVFGMDNKITALTLLLVSVKGFGAVS